MPDVVRTMGVWRLAAIAGVAFAAAGLIFWFAIQSAKPSMGLLFSGLDPRDSAAIVERLEAQGIQYELRGDGGTIMVAQDEALRLRMEFAGEGLPAGGGVGYEIFDSQDVLGVTQFQQNVNKLRALEGELSRTIRALEGVESARVHLVLPERRLFQDDAAKPSASIVLRLRGGRLSDEGVAAIRHLVASAVEGLSPERVSVVDDKGRLLAGGEGEDAPGAAQSRMMERQAAHEEALRRRIEEIVAGIVGPGKARVQVTAEMDFSRTTTESVRFDPDGQVVRSTQTRSNNADSQNTQGDPNVSVGSQVPGGSGAGAGAGDQSRETETSADETVNYEISQTKETSVKDGGVVKRLSVAVAVDGIWTPGADGAAPAYAARPEEEMAKIESLVRAGMGFDEKRGDALQVVNVAFAQGAMGGEGTVAEESGFLGLSGSDIMRLIELAVIAVVTLLAILLFFRPLMKRLFEQATGAPAAGTPLLTGPGAAALATPAPGQAAIAGPAIAGALPAPEKSATEAMIDIARIDGQVRESSVKKVGELVNHHPEEAVSIMRQWLHESA